MTAAKAEQSVEFAFAGADIYWRAAAGPDAGKADVFIDGALEKTVDLYFQECALPYQFAFIKTGLNPKKPHTIKVVARGDNNSASSGTTIRHIAFEHAVELDRSVQLAFQADDIYLYWRPVAGIDQGVADVYIDNVFEKTVDLLFKERTLPYDFTFIKSGLDPKKPHTIKVVARGGDKNSGSSGTTIRHIAALEHAVGPDMSAIIPLSGEWLARQTNRLDPLPMDGIVPDPGISAAALPLLAADAPETGFAKVPVPVYWESYGGDWECADGEAVFRKTVNIPEAWNGKSLTLHLGPVDDFDSTYFNGVKVGSIDITTPKYWSIPRVYTIPAELVKAGRAVIAVRVFDHKGHGGLVGNEIQYYLELSGQKVEPK